MDYVCRICLAEFSSIKNCFTHLKYKHCLRDNSENIQCIVNQPNNHCMKSYNTFEGMRKHAKNCLTTKEANNESSVNNAVEQIESLSNIVANESTVDDQPHYNEDVWSCFDCLPYSNDTIENSKMHEYTNDTSTITNIVNCITNIPSRVLQLNLTEQKNSDVLSLITETVRNVNKLNEQLLSDSSFPTHIDALKTSTEFVLSTINDYRTEWKRRKQMKNDVFYVHPTATAIGTRFETRKSHASKSAVPIRLQCKFSYVSILDTLRALFSNVHFLRTYLDYNKFEGNGHNCRAGEYIDFCCGHLYQNSALFKQRPENIQIQIFQDDFEVCVPIGSKATLHKMCGVYFTIRNWPNSSKLRHIYLIALCNTDDLKSMSTDFNNIRRVVTKEIKILESDGIEISSSLKIRGSLTNICADNAGANTCLGFAESFSASYYCRICELPKNECQKVCSEKSGELRTLEKYEKSLAIVKNSTKVDYAETKGLKVACVLNEISNFHVTRNYCIDIMHDLTEGVIPFAMKHILNYCLENKIVSANILVARTQYHDFGMLNKKNKPSNLQLEKLNLNQNASQMMCLFQHLPFILLNYKNKLNTIWKCMRSLYKIVQIVYSSKIAEKDLAVLSKSIHDHLSSMLEQFPINLLPKHHFMTHYPTVIRAIGPLRCHSVIRYEAKHQFFKQVAKGNKNFKNLTKTLSEKHQRKMCNDIKNFNSIQHILPGKKKTFVGDLDTNFHILFELENLQIDDQKFVKGLCVLHNQEVFEIIFILETINGYVLFCNKYNFIEYSEFTNSFKIKLNNPQIQCFIDFDTFKY